MLDKIHDHATGLRRSATVGLSTVLLVVFGTLAANADTTDPGVSAVSDKFTALTSSVTTVLIPALLLLALAGVGVFMGIRWVKKGAAKA